MKAIVLMWVFAFAFAGACYTYGVWTGDEFFKAVPWETCVGTVASLGQVAAQLLTDLGFVIQGISCAAAAGPMCTFREMIGIYPFHGLRCPDVDLRSVPCECAGFMHVPACDILTNPKPVNMSFRDIGCSLLPKPTCVARYYTANVAHDYCVSDSKWSVPCECASEDLPKCDRPNPFHMTRVSNECSRYTCPDLTCVVDLKRCPIPTMWNPAVLVRYAAWNTELAVGHIKSEWDAASVH